MLMKSYCSSEYLGPHSFMPPSSCASLEQCGLDDGRDSGGAIVFREGSNGRVMGCKFPSNKAVENGGAIVAAGSNTHVLIWGPLVISRNRAGTNGGAVFATNGATLELFDVDLVENHAETDGGAIAAMGAASVNMTSCNISTNTCGQGGGGVSVESAVFRGIETIFQANKAELDGGGLRGFMDAKVELRQCHFEKNGGLVSLEIPYYMVINFVDISFVYLSWSMA